MVTPKHKSIATKAGAYFDNLWRRGDYWQLESLPFEREKYARQLALVSDRRYGRTLEIGCGAGAFTRFLAPLSEYVLGVDVSQVAIERARGCLSDPHVEFLAVDVMEAEVESSEPWDLVVMSETIYYLGWLHTFFEVGWLAERLYAGLRPGGRLLMANTLGTSVGYLLRPSLIRTYRDLLVNAGFEVAREETCSGTKDDVRLDALISLFERPMGGPEPDENAPRGMW